MNSSENINRYNRKQLEKQVIKYELDKLFYSL